MLYMESNIIKVLEKESRKAIAKGPGQGQQEQVDKNIYKVKNLINKNCSIIITLAETRS